MPSRSDCIVRCSTCGVRWGSVKRAAAFEEASDVERGILAAETPRMIRHHQLGHRLELGPNAPREFLGVIAEAARRVAEERGVGGEAGDVAEPGRLRLAAIEHDP